MMMNDVSRRGLLRFGAALVATRAGLLVPSREVLVPEAGEVKIPKGGRGFITIPIENVADLRWERESVEWWDRDGRRKFVPGQRRVFLTLADVVTPMAMVHA
jgi:hypothetical protein